MTKKKSSKKSKKIVMVSGGYDPVHIGHIRQFKAAKALGDKLVVVLNNDNWLKLKKGYVFMPENERKEILEGIKYVDEVVISKHKPNTEDISIYNELQMIRPHIFAKGGDRKPSHVPIPTPEVTFCEEIGCEIIYNVGEGGKVQSSSELVKKAQKAKNKK
ncbi:MAG: adenylyltransferase/cytidyltransferase family protein [Candidatus Nomurabacteria bacterium]|nr:adenylyltransferase/cytidyltransferase family protein [Candidatus Nomurabacteria bacterium]